MRLFPNHWIAKASLGLLLAGGLFAWYWHAIQDGVRVPYYKSWDGKETRYIRMNFGAYLLPCLIDRIVVEPEAPYGRIFGKTYIFEDGFLDPKIIDYGDIDSENFFPKTIE